MANSTKGLPQALKDARNEEDAGDRCQGLAQIMGDPEWPFYERVAMAGVEYVSSSPGRVEYTFTVTKDKCNASGNLHGGCAATLLDNLTSTANLTLPTGSEFASTVSRTLSCTYLRALPLGEKCTVIGEVVRGGKRLINFRGEIRGSDGKVAVICTHDKATVGPSL